MHVRMCVMHVHAATHVSPHFTHDSANIVPRHATVIQCKALHQATASDVGDSKNTVRGYSSDIPRFEESLND